MGSTVTTYDALQHCMALATPPGKTVAMTCPTTGTGDELSPDNLVEAAIGGCMLMSMGTVAMGDDPLDIEGARAAVRVQATGHSVLRYEAIHVTMTMPQSYPAEERKRLERAAERCPIKHAFAADVAIYVRYDYPDESG